MDYIDIIGGELFCRNDWDKILTFLVKNNMSPSYISTKVPMDKSMAIQLKESGYSRVVQFSIDSLYDESLTNIIGVKKGYAAKLLSSIHTLDELGVHIQVNTVLTKWNSLYEEINTLFGVLSSIKNITHWEIRVPEKSLYSPASFEKSKATKQQLERILKYIKTSIMPNSTFKIYISDEALYPELRMHSTSCTHYPGGICGILEDRCFILPDGKVSVCEQMYWHNDFIIGDLREKSLDEIWQSEKAWSIFNRLGSFAHKHDICMNCNDSSECLHSHRKCWIKTMKAYGRDRWHYPDPRCINSPQIKEDPLSYE